MRTCQLTFLPLSCTGYNFLLTRRGEQEHTCILSCINLLSFKLGSRLQPPSLVVQSPMITFTPLPQAEVIQTIHTLYIYNTEISQTFCSPCKQGNQPCALLLTSYKCSCLHDPFLLVKPCQHLFTECVCKWFPSISLEWALLWRCGVRVWSRSVKEKVNEVWNG